MNGELVLEADSVVAQYDRAIVNKPVSFSLRRHEIGMLHGGNGCGKTSILGTIIGAVSTRSGTVSILGLEPRTQTPWRITRNCARVIPQFSLLPAFLSVHEYILAWSMSLTPQPTRRVRNQRIARVQSRLSDEIRVMPGVSIGALSFGQRRFLDILLGCEADLGILLADEPLVGLSRTLILNVVALVTSFARRGGAVLLVAHSVEAVHWKVDWQVEVLGT